MLGYENKKLLKSKFDFAEGEMEDFLYGVTDTNKENVKQLLFAENNANHSKMVLKRDLFSNFMNLTLTSTFQKLNFFVFNKRVFNLIGDKRFDDYSNFSDDFITFLINKSNKQRMRQVLKTKNTGVYAYILDKSQFFLFVVKKEDKHCP